MTSQAAEDAEHQKEMDFEDEHDHLEKWQLPAIVKKLDSQELADFYKRLGDKRVWSREIIEFAGKQWKLMTPDHPTVTLMDIYGKKHKIDTLDFCVKRAHPMKMMFLSYEDLANTTLERFEWFSTSAPEQRSLYWVIRDDLANKLIPFWTLPLRDEPEEVLEDDLKIADGVWKNCVTRTRFLKLIRKAEDFVRIRKIIGFGLGTVSTVKMSPLVAVQQRMRAKNDVERPLDEKEKEELAMNLHHHLAVFDAANELREMYHLAEPIPVFLQDPIYSAADKKALSKRYESVKFLDNPDGLLQVDEHTLVMAHGTPQLPVREILADLGVEYGGPAGFFCNKIFCARRPWNWDYANQIWYYGCLSGNPLNRYAAHMIQDFKMLEVGRIKKWQESKLYLKKLPKEEPPKVKPKGNKHNKKK